MVDGRATVAGGRVSMVDGRATVAGGRVAMVDGRETGAGGRVEGVTVSDPNSLFMMMGRKDYLMASIVHSTLVHVCRTSVIFSGCMFYLLLKHLPGALSCPFRLPFFPFFLEGGDKGCGGRDGEPV